MTLQIFSIRRVQAFCYRYPLSTPVVTSFGRMLNRPAVFVRVEDEDGQVGWGEVWANFPSTGAEHRARLVNEVLAPTLSGFAANEPSDVFDTLTKGTSVLALLKLKIGFDLALLEVDANDNPLRDRFRGPVADIRDGMVRLGDNPGLGIEPDLSSIEQYRTA